MPYPGMAFVFVVGMGLAAVLYYMFTDSNNPHQHNSHGSNDSGPPSDISNSWSVQNNEPRQRRRKRSNGIDINECTICLTEISAQRVNIYPCGHSFHKKCIQDWQQRGVVDIPTCPNCRRKIDKVF